MFRHEESHGKYAVVSEAAWSSPPKRQSKAPKYYTPFSTRWPALTLIFLIILACIAVLEYGVRSGLTLEEKDQQQNQSRLKRQDTGVSSSPTTAISTTVIDDSSSSTSTQALTVSTSSGAYVDPATTSASGPSSTSITSTMLPVTSSTTAYIDPITSQTSTTPSTVSTAYVATVTSSTKTSGGMTTTMTTTSGTGAYVAQSTTDPDISATPVMTSGTTPYIVQSQSTSTTPMMATTTVGSGTTPYIVPSTTSPGTSATPLKVSSSTTVYIAQSTAAPSASGKGTTSTTTTWYETTTGYVKQSTTTKSTNPYTVPSNSATSRTRTTTPIAVTGSGVVSTTDVDSISQTSSFGTFGLSSGQIYTASTPSSSAQTSYQQLTALITYTTEDASGNTVTAVATETYGVAVMTETVLDASGSLSTITATLTSYSGTIAPTVLAESTSVPTTPPDHQRADEVELGLALSNLQYFRAIYLPVLVAVVLKLIWAIVFTSTKMMEPFHLLSREKGASATESLLADYLATSLSIDDIWNMFLCHPVVTLVGVVYLCLSALPAIATQSTTVRAIAWCRSPTLIMERCNPMWYLKVDYTRALQAVLSLIAVIILLVIALSSRRRSGVFSNPSSIATMASLLNSEDFMEDLRKIDQRSSRSSAKQILEPYRYMLRQHQTATGYIRYGIVKAPEKSPEHSVRYTKQPKYSALAPRPGESQMHTSKSTLSNRFLVDTIFLLCILALLGVLVGYYMDGHDDPFNNYFNHNPTSQLVLTAAASLLDIRWKQLEREVRLLTPYRRLFQGSSKPEATILVSQNSTPLTSIFQALWRGNLFHAFVAFVAILSDVLIIAIGGVPFNSAQIWLDFLVSIYTSWAILALMVLTVFAIFRWRALNEKMMMPCEPTRPLAVWLMLCNRDNHLREEMQGYETMAPRERDDKVKMRGGLYWAGWLTQPDGSRRWCLEKENGQASGMNMLTFAAD
ncbi:hypothetical protein AYO21_00800 [Fonsecaea monophora]|uniref:Uncharacterized protein n=1 Tax=Fonsecaea monophora TaxID=254056 RepID=A0A177FKP0_9EURO|nr:hypothetical protein AYO21_00800 [Fonsecaea monophora]OAG44838.1 hypothetical protein AYO21_00800 [Fonsecaea monophora]